MWTRVESPPRSQASPTPAGVLPSSDPLLGKFCPLILQAGRRSRLLRCGLRKETLGRVEVLGVCGCKIGASRSTYTRWDMRIEDARR